MIYYDEHGTARPFYNLIVYRVPECKHSDVYTSFSNTVDEEALGLVILCLLLLIP